MTTKRKVWRCYFLGCVPAGDWSFFLGHESEKPRLRWWARPFFRIAVRQLENATQTEVG